MMRWINLKPTMQNEVSQREKSKYQILMHLYGIERDDIDEPICKAAVEMQTEQTYGHSGGRRGYDTRKE